MRNSIFILFFLFTIKSTHLFSNNPGFLGRKFIVGYEFGLNHPIIQGTSGKIPSLYNTAKIEYVISRKFSLGASYLNHTYKNYPITSNIYTGNSGGSYYVPIFDNLKGNFVSHNIALYVKMYSYLRSDGIAPLGYFFKFGIGTTIAKDFFYFKGISSNSNGSPSQSVEVKSYLPFIKGGVGRDFIIFKRVVLSLGIDFNYTIPNFLNEYSDPQNLNDELAFKSSYRNILHRNLFNIYLGLGFLAF